MDLISRAVVLSLLWTGVSAPAASTAPPGVVVESVGRQQAGERAGVLAGDVLLFWHRAARDKTPGAKAAGRTITSPFGFAELEAEESLRGPLRLSLSRAGEKLDLSLGPGKWGITVRPVLPPPVLAKLHQARDLWKERKTEAGAALLTEAADELRKAGAGPAACWILLETARSWTTAGDRGRATRSFEAAAKDAGRLSPEISAQVLDAKAEVLARQSDLPAAEAAYREAAKLRERRSARSLALAVNFDQMLRLAMYRGDIAGAERFGRRALAIRQAAAPGTLAVAESWNSLGSVAHYATDLPRAEAFHRKGLTLSARLLPGSLEHARSAHNLGVVLDARGDLGEAERLFRFSLDIFERVGEGRRTAASLNALALLYRARGDFDSAEEFHQRSLAIHEKLAPGGIGVAETYNLLGSLSRMRGDLTTSAERHRKALAIREKLGPESLNVAASLANLARTSLDQGDFAEAEAFARRSLAIRENKAPGSLAVAWSLQGLGDIAWRRGEADAALSWFRAALDIRERLAPGSGDLAESLYAVGRSLRKTDLTASGFHLNRALDALDLARGRLGGSEDARSGWAARYAEMYHSAIETALDRGRNDEAFHILERARARAILAMLAERDLSLEREIPPALARKLRETNAEYDRTQSRLAEVVPSKEGDLAGQLSEKLRALARKRAEIGEEIRAVSPRLASLQAPRPLTLREAEGVLDPGTVLLSYSVGAETTVLFTLAAGRGASAARLGVHRLPVGRDELQKETQLFRNLLLSGRDGSRTSEALNLHAHRLFQILLKPAMEALAGSDRAVVCPDGPLHAVPFAALVISGAQEHRPTYLAERVPLHTTLSATLYGELRKTRKQAAARGTAWKFALFGDPIYPGAARAAARGAEPEMDELGGDASAAALVEAERGGSSSIPAVRALTLAPLPASRQEVEAIASLYPGRSVSFLGSSANETRAKSLGRSHRYVHFACHGLLDRRFPLDSGLALSSPARPKAGEDNGLLQAWEIFESLRLDADLVTLSACESGLGAELPGEGLQSLARAFQFAGARSVLASLWAVTDATSARLMTRFYAALKKGTPKDRALRDAQMSLIRESAGASHPFFWAGFELIGDWR